MSRFLFESHTYTHPILNTYTQEQVRTTTTISLLLTILKVTAELLPNIDVAREFFGTAESTASYSAHAMVTPSVSV